MTPLITPDSALLWARAGKPEIVTFFALPAEQQAMLADAADDVFAAREAAKMPKPMPATEPTDDEKRMAVALAKAASDVEATLRSAP